MGDNDMGEASFTYCMGMSMGDNDMGMPLLLTVWQCLWETMIWGCLFYLLYGHAYVGQ